MNKELLEALDILEKEKEISKKVKEMLELVALKGFERKNVTKLSGGQQIICDYLVSKSLREINGWKYPQWTDEVCRVSNSIDRLQEVFDFDINEWQNIVLLTDDYAKLSVEYLKGA